MSIEEVGKKLESKVDLWLNKFDEEPVSTGVKVLLIVLLLRWIWRAFK